MEIMTPRPEIDREPETPTEPDSAASAAVATAPDEQVQPAPTPAADPGAELPVPNGVEAVAEVAPSPVAEAAPTDGIEAAVDLTPDEQGEAAETAPAVDAAPIAASGGETDAEMASQLTEAAAATAVLPEAPEAQEAPKAPEASAAPAEADAGPAEPVELAEPVERVEPIQPAEPAPPESTERVELVPPAEPARAAPTAEAETPVPGAAWGYVDAEGNVWQRGGELHQGRVVGRATGHNPALALAFFAREFERVDERARALAAEVAAASHKAPFLGRVRRLLEEAPKTEGIGDFDDLIRRLHALEADVVGELARRREAKERLAARAEALQDSTEWKAAGDELRALFEQWKSVGSLARDEEQALWERFNTARQAFYARRQAFFAERERERAENLAKKEDLGARAEALRDSTDWRATAEALKALQAEWKTVGSAGREQDQALWARFRGAMDVFFANRAAAFAENKRKKLALCEAAEALGESTDWSSTSATLKGLQEQWKQIGYAGGNEDDALWGRFRRALDAFYARRSEVYAERDRAYGENLRQKEALVNEAEALLVADDMRGATQRIKALQEEWRAIGPVPRERADEIWTRFRAACDGVFRRAREEWERRQTAARTGLKDSLDRQRAFARELMDSIARDDELLGRWREQLAGLRPGGREAEIRRDLEGKIASVEERVRGKQARIEQLLASIAEAEARLTAEASR
jgi:hypothetical protein